jgi:hypothetical protein
VAVRYMRAEQQAAVAVEPLRLTCASSGADSAAAAAAAVAVSSAPLLHPPDSWPHPLLHPPVSWPHPLLPAAPSDATIEHLHQRTLVHPSLLFV